MKVQPAPRPKAAARNDRAESSKRADKPRSEARTAHAAEAEKQEDKGAGKAETILDPIGNATRNIEGISEALKNKDVEDLARTALVVLSSAGSSLVLPPSQLEQIKEGFSSSIERLFGA
jgi:hypothetical protein